MKGDIFMKCNKDELIKEIINFVITASDVDKIILSTFIAGMQAKENSLQNTSELLKTKINYNNN